MPNYITITMTGERATSPDRIGRLLRARQPVANRSQMLHGEPATPPTPYSASMRFGRVAASRDIADQLRNADYILWYHTTPILFHEHPEGGWHMPRLYLPTLRYDRTLNDHVRTIRHAMNTTSDGMIYHPAWHGGPFTREADSSRWCRYQWGNLGYICTLNSGHPRGWWHEAWQSSGTDPVSAISTANMFTWDRATMAVQRRNRV